MEKNILKNQIEKLIKIGKYKEAFSELENFKVKYGKDINCYSLEALIYILENQIERANQILKEGYLIEKNYDILYRLGMVSESLNNNIEALKYYNEAKQYTDKLNHINYLNGIIYELSSEVILNESESLDDFWTLVSSSNIIDCKTIEKIVKDIYPTNIIIETIRGCNLKCPFCPLQLDEKINDYGIMKDEIFNNILEKVITIENIKLFIMHNLGEPLLDKNIFKRISEIKKIRNDVEILIDSNLSLEFSPMEMVNSGLDVLDVAFDGANQESYSKYRKNGNLDKVISNIVRIATTKKMFNAEKPTINVKTVIFKHVVDEMNLISKIASQSGANNYVLQTAIFGEKKDENPKEWIPEKQEWSRYDVDKLYNENKLVFYKNTFENSKSCSGILQNIPPVIDFKGNVYPCCHCCTDEKYNMGNIKEKSFEEIWQSSKYVEFRLNVLKNRFKYNVCSNCYRPSHEK